MNTAITLGHQQQFAPRLENMSPQNLFTNINDLIAFVAESDRNRQPHVWYGNAKESSFHHVGQKVRAICDSFGDALLWFESVPRNYQPIWFHWLVINYPTHILKTLTTNSCSLEHMIRCFEQLTDAQLCQILTKSSVIRSNAVIGLILIGFKYEHFTKIQQKRSSLVKISVEESLILNIQDLLQYQEMVDPQWLLHLIIYHADNIEKDFLSLNPEQTKDIIASFNLLSINDFLKKTPAESVASCIGLLTAFVQPEKLCASLSELAPQEYANVISKICSNNSFEQAYWKLLKIHQRFSKPQFLNAAYAAFSFLKIEDYTLLTSIIHHKFLFTRDDRPHLLKLFPDSKSVILGLKASGLKNSLLLALLDENGQGLLALGLSPDTVASIFKMFTERGKKERIIIELGHIIESTSNQEPQTLPQISVQAPILEKTAALPLPADETEETASAHSPPAFNEEQSLVFLEQFLDESALELKTEQLVIRSIEPQRNSIPHSYDFDELFPYSLNAQNRARLQGQEHATNSSLTATLPDTLALGADHEEELLGFLNELDDPAVDSIEQEVADYSTQLDDLLEKLLAEDDSALRIAQAPILFESNLSPKQGFVVSRKRTLAEMSPTDRI